MATDTDGEWVGGWEADEARRRADWLRLTPADRLRWLEHAIRFAHRHGGALRRRAAPGTAVDSGSSRPGSSSAGR